MTDLTTHAMNAIAEKHNHAGQTVAGFSIKKIRTLSGWRHEVTYTEGVDAPLVALFARHVGRRDRPPRQRLVFTIDPQTGRTVLQDAG
jgi:hypothetical protein